jgi:hypothetical protein
LYEIVVRSFLPQVKWPEAFLIIKSKTKARNVTSKGLEVFNKEEELYGKKWFP